MYVLKSYCSSRNYKILLLLLKKSYNYYYYYKKFSVRKNSFLLNYNSEENYFLKGKFLGLYLFVGDRYINSLR